MGYTRTLKYAKFLKEEDLNLSDFEALQIAVKMDANENFESANMLDYGNGVPVALEKIAMELEEMVKNLKRDA